MKKRVSRAVAKAKSKVAVLRRMRRAAGKIGGKVRSIGKRVRMDLRLARLDRPRAHKVHGEVQFDVKMHKLEKGWVKDALHEVDELKCATDDLRFLADTSKKVKDARKNTQKRTASRHR